MIQSFSINLKSSWLDRERQLIINRDFVEFDNKNRIAETSTKFTAEEIDSFRFGVKWIKGYQFAIGRIYCIDIKSKENSVIKIRLKSLYGINKKILGDKYSAIINALYEYHFDNMIMAYLQKFNNNYEFEILKVRFNQLGLTFTDKNVFLPWNDVDTRAYSTYYSIFSTSNTEIYKIFEFLNDWNTGILYSISRQILKEKGLYSE